MKKLIFIAGLLIMSLQTVTINAQIVRRISNENMKKEPIDDVQFVVQYQTKMVTDTINPEKVSEESMILKIGSKSSEYYSYTRFIADSISKEQRKGQNPININGASIRAINQGSFPNSGIVNYQIYKNFLN